MSAWMVSKRHVDYLLSAALRYGKVHPLRWYLPATTETPQPYEERRRELAPENASSVGAMLWTENRVSVNHRYNQKGGLQSYRFARYPGDVDPVVVLKSIRCYVYQSCEHPGWEQSEARAFCDALTLACFDKLPGYDAAPWGIDS